MSNGKGDTPRPVNGDKYHHNYDIIFVTKIKPRLNSSAESTHHENKQQATAPKANVENERRPACRMRRVRGRLAPQRHCRG
jgi:hypothetical protein